MIVVLGIHYTVDVLHRCNIYALHVDVLENFDHMQYNRQYDVTTILAIHRVTCDVRRERIYSSDALGERLSAGWKLAYDEMIASPL